MKSNIIFVFLCFNCVCFIVCNYVYVSILLVFCYNNTLTNYTVTNITEYD